MTKKAYSNKLGVINTKRMQLVSQFSYATTNNTKWCGLYIIYIHAMKDINHCEGCGLLLF